MTGLEMTYDDVKRQIYALAWRYKKYCGNDLDSALSIAHEYFMEAYHDYEREESGFLTWMTHRIRWAYIKEVKARMKEQRMRSEMDPALVAERRSQFSLEEFIEDLSEDARTVVKLTLDCPREIQRAFRLQKRRWVKDALKTAGWSMNRIMETFKEIQEALT